MALAKTGWLAALLSAEVTAHVPPAAARPGPARLAARKYLRAVLRETGLLYGTPRVSEATQEEAPRGAEAQLFFAVLRTLVRIALDIATVVQAPPGPREVQVEVLLAALAGDRALAEALDAASRAQQSSLKRLEAKLEAVLERRSVSLSGDPSYGLVLHNGALYADAQLFGRQAIDYFVRGRFAAEAAERRRYVSSQQKVVLVEVLVALACAERPPTYPARRAILRQIEDLSLPDTLSAQLEDRVRLTFERRPSLARIVAQVRSSEVRRFLLEQTLLASLVDGQRSPGEIAFLAELASTLGYSPAEVQRVELEMAEFYRRNRHVVDVFTVTAGAEVMGEELIDTMQRTMTRNFQSLMQEVRETGELSMLIARAARGQTLSAEERQRMRAQLIDVAKAIPALAIFAAPGGLLLLLALAKVLPFDLLPSAFKQAPAEPPPRSKPPRR